MVNQSLSLILVYEPDFTNCGPVPIVRTADPRLIVAVAVQAIDDATARANTLSSTDEVLGELERTELERLAAILKTLIPGLEGKRSPARVPVM
jgi:hypothetical protein